MLLHLLQDCFLSTLFITTQCSLLKSLRETVLLEFSARKKLPPLGNFYASFFLIREPCNISHFPFAPGARKLKAKFDA